MAKSNKSIVVSPAAKMTIDSNDFSIVPNDAELANLLAELEYIADTTDLTVVQPATEQVRINNTLALASLPKTVLLTFPLTSISNTYLGAMNEGKEIWFDKKALVSYSVDGQDGAKTVTVEMQRSKAVRRKLVAAVA